MTLWDIISLLLLAAMSYLTVEVIIRLWSDEGFAHFVFRASLTISGLIFGFAGGWLAGGIALAVPCTVLGGSVGFFLGRWYDELTKRR